ncbi:hypothetical protein, partial [Halomonas sp. S2151]|uniref:hypothetical protein n=1 Tax=Halomonas sp. S2151 TaxID=579478 RepID=UPI000A64E9B1
MFSKDQTAGRVVCLADYGRLKAGAIVPESNELYADVEAWIAEGNTLAEFKGYPDTRLLDDVKQAAMRRINSAYEAELASIRSEYPESEQMTWDKQEREARAFLADSATATPLLDAMATGRGMDKAELATRIIAKADAWMQASGLATGKRQALEDQVKAAETVEAVEAIGW